MEPNGAIITSKIRQVASTLLNQPRASTTNPEVSSAPGPQPLSVAEAESYLHAFIDTLMRLEGLSVTNSTVDAATAANSPPQQPGRSMSYLSYNLFCFLLFIYIVMFYSLVLFGIW